MGSPIFKGDTIILEVTIEADITDWKIRAEIFDDCGHCIKLATDNVTGGSDDQIEIISTSATSSVFEVKVPADATACFKDKSMIEIEVETLTIIAGKAEKRTVLREGILFEDQEIEWDSIS